MQNDKSPKASIDEVGFRGRQFTSTLANQYSSRLSCFSPFVILGPLSGPETSKKDLATSEKKEWWRRKALISQFSAMGPALADGGISILVGTSVVGTVQRFQYLSLRRRARFLPHSIRERPCESILYSRHSFFFLSLFWVR